MIVLDAGALVAIDRGDRRMWAELEAARRAAVTAVIPFGALAQAWRDGSRQARLAMVVNGSQPASFDRLARQAGVLCGRAGTADVVDASVAITAARPGTLVLFTSDKSDMDELLDAIGGHHPRVVSV